MPFRYVTLFLLNRNSMPLVRSVTTLSLRPIRAAKSSSTLPVFTPCLREIVAGHLVEVRGLQQRLGRDAADIEAGAAERAAHFDAGGLEAELRRLDGADIAARTAADHHHVECLFRHVQILFKP